tara:strand:- start:107 stop:667 length:561 start_codon:yes stop_codon:yes gene_type:complete
MKNVFISCGYSLVGLGAIGWIGILLLVMLLVDPGDSAITNFFANHIIVPAKLENWGATFSDIVVELFFLIFQMNLILLTITSLVALGWSAGSHYLNIDAPGKAKIYFIHWVIFTAIFVFIVLCIVFFFTESTTFESAQFIGGKGKTIIYSLSLIYYFLMYYVGVILGTARFARSSVLLANKLPGNL